MAALAVPIDEAPLLQFRKVDVAMPYQRSGRVVVGVRHAPGIGRRKDPGGCSPGVRVVAGGAARPPAPSNTSQARLSCRPRGQSQKNWEVYYVPATGAGGRGNWTHAFRSHLIVSSHSVPTGWTPPAWDQLSPPTWNISLRDDDGVLKSLAWNSHEHGFDGDVIWSAVAGVGNRDV